MYVKTYPSGIHLKEESCKPRKTIVAAENEPQDKWSQETAELSILEQLKPAWMALRALGLMPFTSLQPTKETEGKRIPIFLLQIAYPIGFYLTFAAISGINMLKIRHDVVPVSTTTPRFIFKLMQLTYFLPHLLIGPMHWASMTKFLSFINNWDKFQVRFQKVTRHRLQLKMRRMSTVMIPLVSIGSFGGGFILKATAMARGEYLPSLSTAYTMTQINLLLALWVLLCLASSKAADQLARELREEFQNGKTVNEQVVPSYHRLWVRLSRLTQEIGTVLSPAFNIIVFTWLLELLLSVFQATTLLANTCNPHTLYSLLMFSLICLGSIQTFCAAANHATDSVRGLFMETLVDIEVEDGSIEKQLQDFEQTVGMHETVISLGGYYNVNRSLVVSILSAFTTFLVVLFQSTSASETYACERWNSAKQNGTTS